MLSCNSGCELQNLGPLRGIVQYYKKKNGDLFWNVLLSNLPKNFEGKTFSGEGYVGVDSRALWHSNDRLAVLQVTIT